MGRGTGFGKTILIGDQFVLYGVPAIVSALPYETVADVERIDGEGGSKFRPPSHLTLTLQKYLVQKRFARSISGHQETLVHFQDLTVC